MGGCQDGAMHFKKQIIFYLIVDGRKETSEGPGVKGESLYWRGQGGIYYPQKES